MTEKDFRQAAVVLILYPVDGRPHGLFIRRTERVADHKGQISLPGGSREPGDASLVETALREAQEEVGIDPASLQVVGQLDPVVTVATRYVITPIVAYCRATPATSSDEFEVAEVIDVPIDSLLAPELPRTEVWTNHGTPRDVYFYDWDNGRHVIWGATARMIRQFLELYTHDWWEALQSGNAVNLVPEGWPTGNPPTPV